MPARFPNSRALACGLGLALLLQGCESRWVETRDVGALRLTEYWSRDRLDWEGGNTYVRRTTLCVRDTRRCLEDRLLTLDPDPELEPPAPRWIHVTGLEDESLSRFLDNYLELAWNGNVPFPRYDWGGGLGYIRDTLCRDAEGNIAFPIASPP